jgi:hypothetical protein
MRAVRRSLAWAAVALTFVASGVAAQRDLTPLQQATDMATSARRAGEPAERAASDIVAALRIASDDVVRALRGGGYAAEQTARATTSALRMSIEQALGVMLANGYGRVESVRGFAAERTAAEPIVRALKNAGTSARQSTSDLLEAGVPRGDAVRYISLVHALAAADMAANLFALGMSAGDAAAAMSEADIPLSLIVSSLRAAGYGVGDIAVALRALGHTAATIAMELHSAGASAIQIALALMVELNEQPIIALKALLQIMDPPEAMAALYAVLEDLQATAQAALGAQVMEGAIANFVFAKATTLVHAFTILRDIGWSAMMAAQDAPQQQDAQAVLVALVQAGYHAAEAAKAVKDALGASAEQLAAGLRQAGQSASAAAAVLYEAFEVAVYMVYEAMIQAVVSNCFEPLQSAYNLTTRQTFDAFHGSAPLPALFAWLATKGENATNAASWAAARGERAHAIAAALHAGFQASAATVGEALRKAGFDAFEVCSALKDEIQLEITEYAPLVQALGFDFQVLVEALARVYHLTVLEVIANLPPGGG